MLCTVIMRCYFVKSTKWRRRSALRLAASISASGLNAGVKAPLKQWSPHRRRRKVGGEWSRLHGRTRSWSAIRLDACLLGAVSRRNVQRGLPRTLRLNEPGTGMEHTPWAGYFGRGGRVRPVCWSEKRKMSRDGDDDARLHPEMETGASAGGDWPRGG